MRKVGMIVAIVAAVLVAAVVIFWATFDVNRYRGSIEAQLQTRFGRAVTLGPMRLGLFPPRFQAERVVIADDPEFHSSVPFVQAHQFNVSVKTLPLLHGAVEITSVDLRQPQ